MIQLNYRDSKPIHEQITNGFRHLIISGALAKDEKLPSVRELASQLAINPNTIQRAYRQLEMEGYIYSVPGRGSFAAEKKEVNSVRIDGLLKNFDEAAKELLYLNYTKEQLAERIEEIGKSIGKGADN